MNPFSAIRNRFELLSTAQRFGAIVAPIGVVASTAWIFSKGNDPRPYMELDSAALFLSTFVTFRVWLLAKSGREDQLARRQEKLERARHRNEQSTVPMLTRICLGGGSIVGFAAPIVNKLVQSQLQIDAAEGIETLALATFVGIPVGTAVGAAVEGAVRKVGSWIPRTNRSTPSPR